MTEDFLNLMGRSLRKVNLVTVDSRFLLTTTGPTALPPTFGAEPTTCTDTLEIALQKA